MSHFNAYMALSGAIDADVLENEPMSAHTSYRIGGPAALFVRPHTQQALARTLEVCHKEGIDWVVVGKGSNILVADEGYAGCVICLGKAFSRVLINELDGGKAMITAGAALPLAKLLNEALRGGYSGLECCAGIPGTVGGALWMNAGTRRDWIGKVTSDVVMLSADGALARIDARDVDWAYRSTTLPAGNIILEASFLLTQSSKEKVAAQMDSLLKRRGRSQPVSVPSCGSVFKNPPNANVGAMIEELGLKGRRCGGAQISDVHANFIVNSGGASARDVLTLINTVHSMVLEHYGVELSCELRFLGFE